MKVSTESGNSQTLKPDKLSASRTDSVNRSGVSPEEGFPGKRERETILSVKQLHKKIGGRTIIKGISFEVYDGEVFGFLGPNGSGKTTTIRMLVDLIRPTGGAIHICGYHVQKEHNQALQYVGAIVENPGLYGYLSGWENLEHFARMLPGVDDKRIQEVVDIVGMDARIHDKVKTYSLGMRQRLGIAQALLNRPRLLILDEPTNGLDPQGIKELREFIRRLSAEGLSVFVSSHLLSEIQQMCDRVAIIAKGEVIRVGEVGALIDQASNTVVWSVKEQDEEEAKRLLSPVTVPGRTMAEADQSGFPACRLHTRIAADEIAFWNEKLVAAGISVYGIEIRQPTLEQLFLELTEGESIG